MATRTGQDRASAASLTGLAEFLAVVERGSFTAAAEALGISKSVVSRRVRALETRTGARLLARTTRRLNLTDMGRLYFERCRQVMDDLEEVEAELADLQARPRGRVRMTAPGLYAEEYVMPAVAEFMTRYPEVHVEIDTQMATTDLVADGYDLAVRMSALADSSLVARKVRDRRLIVCAAPSYLESRGVPVRPQDLAGHNCLRLGTMPWRFSEGDTVREVRVRGSLTTDSGRALLVAARAGIGLIRLTDYYVGAAIAAGDLVPVLVDNEVADAATWIVFPDRRQMPTRARLLIDHLAQALRRD